MPFAAILWPTASMSLLLAQHNVPLALADHLSPLIRDIFDGEVASDTLVHCRPFPELENGW